MDTNEDLYLYFIEILETLFNRCQNDPRLIESVKKGDVRISAPFFLIDIYANRYYNVDNVKSGNVEYKGIKLIPTHVSQITLFHIEYPRYQEPWMLIVKIL